MPDLAALYHHLEHDPPRRFLDWPDSALAKGPPGIYTLWADDALLYVGISYMDAKDTTTPKLPAYGEGSTRTSEDPAPGTS